MPLRLRLGPASNSLCAPILSSSLGRRAARPPPEPATNQPAFPERVRKVIRDLRRGEVVSYGEVARRAGYPRAARAVGNILASNLGLPWWRVVRANGELAAHSREEQARRLRREGVQVQNGRCQVRPNRKKRTLRHSS
ncbi:MAG: MGMT family protein [Chloroflexi bacterium]|nr:MAG: MGMT family protein [Chloroflexota bacterium]